MPRLEAQTFRPKAALYTVNEDGAELVDEVFANTAGRGFGIIGAWT